MGTPDFAVPSLRSIEKNYNIVAVYSQPARPSGRGMKTKLSSVEKNAKSFNRILSRISWTMVLMVQSSETW